jgi:tetratricopeptide (TPR) repeat protein
MVHQVSRLHRFVVEYYSLEELRTLCFDLGIEYERLGGDETRDAKARELVLQLGKERRLDQLLAILEENRSVHFEQAGLSRGSEALDAFYGGLVSFEARTKPLHERLLERLGQELRFSFVAVSILVIALIGGGTFFLYRAVLPRKPSRMSGDFRIGVAGFAERGRFGESDVGTELADGVYLRLEQSFDEIDLGFTVTIWGPDQVGTVRGADHEERARSAARVAGKIDADVIVYGCVDTSNAVWQVSPEFYVSAKSFYQAEEVTGQHELGVPLQVRGQGSVADRIEVSEEFGYRTEALTRITVGLAYYAIGKFEEALRFFESAEGIEGWKDDEGKQVLYLLVGNSAGRIGDLDLAGAYHKKSLSVDSEYARAYVGLASSYYMLALKPYEESGDPAKTDIDLLRLAIGTYERASEAAHQPVLSDIETKVHFGLGQCYFMLVYSGVEELFTPAIAEFEAVIKEYGDGANPRVLELAVESYARLGLIYDLCGHPNLAIRNYEKAGSLLKGDPEKRSLYEERAENIRRRTDTTR